MVESVGRIFVGLGFAPEVRAAVDAYVRFLPLARPTVPPQNLHITLRFLGSIDEVAFDRLLAGLDLASWPSRFRLRIRGLGAFPSARSATVAWLGVDDPSGGLEQLWETVDQVCASAGLGHEDRPFQPHVTVARLRPPVDMRRMIDEAPLVDLRTAVDAVTVFRSRPGRGAPLYEPLERFPLETSPI